jgi:amino acid permease
MNTLVKSSIYSALGFYIFIGFTGSMYGNCVNTSSDDENQDKYVVKDNILLSFPEDDSLINLGRACLTLTITLAFPVLVVPARDVFLRAAGILLDRGNDSKTQAQVQATVDIVNPSELAEPLLSQNAVDEENEYTQDENITGNDRMINSSYIRIITSICILWIGALLACVVTSIDTVWGILGSSLSLIMGIFIPCGAYLVLSKLDDNREEAHLDGSCNEERKLRYVAWFIIYLFVPITVMCSGNAIYNVMND